MCSKFVAIFLIFACVSACDALAQHATSDVTEATARGKKKKISLLIFVADIIVKKLFIFKLVYAFVLWIVIHKAGYFLTWFISYLNQQKKDFQEPPHHHYGPHHDYGPPHQEYGPPYHYSSYGPAPGPYKRVNHH